MLILYVLNEDCPNFFKNIAKLIADTSEGMIVIEDFNCVVGASVDWLPSTICLKSKKYFTLRALIEEWSLVDVCHPRERDCTFSHKYIVVYCQGQIQSWLGVLAPLKFFRRVAYFSRRGVAVARFAVHVCSLCVNWSK